MQDPLLDESPIEDLHVQLICRGKHSEVLDQALAVLESVPLLAPTHHGITDGIRDPYQRATLIAEYDAIPDAAPVFMRTTKPGRFSGHCYGTDAAPLLNLQLSPRDRLSTGMVEDFLTALSQWAGALPALDVGSVDIEFVAQPAETRMGEARGHSLDEYALAGPKLLFARNYFGARTVELAGGDEAFALSGFDVRKLPNGGMRLDLLRDPWTQSPHALKEAQARGLSWLDRVGLRAKATQRGTAVPGPRWVAPTGP